MMKTIEGINNKMVKLEDVIIENKEGIDYKIISPEEEMDIERSISPLR